MIPRLTHVALPVLIAGVVLAGCLHPKAPGIHSDGPESATIATPDLMDPILLDDEAEFATFVRDRYYDQPAFLRIGLPIKVGRVNFPIDEPTARAVPWMNVSIPYHGDRVYRLDVFGELVALKDWVDRNVNAFKSPSHGRERASFEVTPIVALPDIQSNGQDWPRAYDRVGAAWFWYPSPFGVFPLAYLSTIRDGSSEMNPKEIVLSDMKVLNVSLISNEDRAATECGRLLWWRSARGTGVSTPTQPGVVLHLMKNTKFAYADVIYTVEDVTEDGLTLSAVTLLDQDFFQPATTSDNSCS